MRLPKADEMLARGALMFFAYSCYPGPPVLGPPLHQKVSSIPLGMTIGDETRERDYRIQNEEVEMEDIFECWISSDRR